MKNVDKKSLRILLAVISLFLVVCCAGIWSKKVSTFHYEESLDRPLLSVDDREVTLREFAYYIFIIEEFVDKQAKLYDANNPITYWNKRFQAGLDSMFVYDMAREEAYETCICDLIYEGMAKEAGFTLEDNKKTEAIKEADQWYAKLSEQLIEKTGIQKEDVEDILVRKKLVAEYAVSYVKEVDFDGYSGYREELISASGDYYKEKIRPEHKIWEDENVKNGIKFGHITVNY